MTPSPHIRRIALIAIIGCAILAGWTNAAAAPPIDDRYRESGPTAVHTAEPRPTSSGGDRDRTLPIALAGAVMLVAVGTAVYSHRTRTSRRAIA
jgi:hypothetical protein